MNVTLGQSELSIPFAFPDGDVAETMSQVLNTPISDAEAERLLVMYWKAIEAGDIRPLSHLDSSTRGAVVNYLYNQKGVAKLEGAAFVTGMLEIDSLWLNPRWTISTDIMRKGKEILGEIPWGKIALYGIGGIILYGAVTSGVTAFALRPRKA